MRKNLIKTVKIRLTHNLNKEALMWTSVIFFNVSIYIFFLKGMNKIIATLPPLEILRGNKLPSYS